MDVNFFIYFILLDLFLVVFVVVNVIVVGKVYLGKDCSIWYGVVVWVDLEVIIIGEGINI